MDEKRWQQIEAICGEALDLRPEEREGFVLSQCGEDEALRDLVLSLIDFGTGASDLLDNPVVTRLGNEPGGSPLPENIGPFSVLGLLGRGGMGEVFLCERAGDGFRLRVAVKLIRRGMAADEVLRRFRLERRILASLDHPGIARFLDGGATHDGVPFFVMEWVDGVPLLEFCDREAASVEERIRLFLRVCDAVEHAHGRLIVHRDIKPSNVLVTSDGTPKLLDFGVAKVLTEEDSWGSLAATRTGVRVLTPPYASPEQISGAPVGTASDVYSLGVVLYELLSGHHPYATGRTSLKEIEDAVSKEQLPRPSDVVNRLETHQLPDGSTETITPEDVSGRRRSTPERLRRTLSGDLDNIVLRALRTDPERRYPSAAALAEDLRRYLDRRPVRARPDTLGYRVGKFVQRNPVAVSLGGALLLTLTVATALTTAQNRRIVAESARVAAERDKALEVQGFLLEAYGATGADRTATDSVTVRAMLDAQVSQARSQYGDRPLVQAELLHALAEAYDRLTLWEEAEPVAREALDIRTAELQEADPDVARSLNLLGRILHEQDKRDEAEERLRASIAAWRSLGDDSAALSRALNDLGILLSNVGAYEEAGQVLTEALELRRAEHGPIHQSVGITANNLATVYSRLGQRGRAAELYGESARVLSEVLGPDHQRVRVAKGNRAAVLTALGELDAAATAWTEVVEAQRRVAGRHFATGWALYHYGNTLRLLGRPGEAEVALYEGLGILESTVGTETSHYAAALLFLGQSRADLGDVEEGHGLAGRSLEIRRRVFGDAHIQVAMGTESLAALTSDPEDAVALHREAVVVFERAVGADNPRTLESLVRLGDRLAAAGRPVEALDAYGQARTRAQAALPEDSAVPAAALLGMAEAQLALGNVSEADSLRIVAEAEGVEDASGANQERLRALAASIGAARPEGSSPVR